MAASSSVAGPIWARAGRDLACGRSCAGAGRRASDVRRRGRLLAAGGRSWLLEVRCCPSWLRSAGEVDAVEDCGGYGLRSCARWRLLGFALVASAIILAGGGDDPDGGFRRGDGELRRGGT